MSGFRVVGKLDGSLYEVEVTGKASRPVVGSKKIANLVKLFEGETVKATPVGPYYKVDPGDPESILALLSEQTTIKRVGDNAPKLVEPRPVGGTY